MNSYSAHALTVAGSLFIPVVLIYGRHIVTFTNSWISVTFVSRHTLRTRANVDLQLLSAALPTRAQTRAGWIHIRYLAQGQVDMPTDGLVCARFRFSAPPWLPKSIHVYRSFIYSHLWLYFQAKLVRLHMCDVTRSLIWIFKVHSSSNNVNVPEYTLLFAFLTL